MTALNQIIRVEKQDEEGALYHIEVQGALLILFFHDDERDRVNANLNQILNFFPKLPIH